MSKEARHHHYLPQCYLRGFLPKGENSSKIVVLDLKRKKYFETGTRNIGGVKDFNRIKAEGLAPDSLENSLSSFEGQVATALRDIENDKNLDNETTYAVIMNLIALVGIRHPVMRDRITDFHAQISKKLMGMNLVSKKRWEDTLQKMREDGVDIGEHISYEKMKEFFESGKYEITVPNETHFDLEFEGIDAILPFLFNRKWALILASQVTGPIITCDRPVSLTWQYPEKLPPIMRYSPGFGMKETDVVFPVSQNMALLGAFEIESEVINADREFVASMNANIMAFAVSQIYTPDLSFVFLDRRGTLKDGHSILKSWVSEHPKQKGGDYDN